MTSPHCHSVLPPTRLGEPASARQTIHTRRADCVGYQRADGLFDIEAELIDVRGLPTHRQSRTLAPGEPLHHMVLLMTVDEDMLIRTFQARTEAGPNRECADINSAYEALVGMTIRSGFLVKVRARLAGVNGCTHLTDMIGMMATTALQTVWAVQAQRESVAAGAGAREKRHWIIGTCHAYRPDGELVKARWPQHAEPGPDAEAGNGIAPITSGDN